MLIHAWTENLSFRNKFNSYWNKRATPKKNILKKHFVFLQNGILKSLWIEWMEATKWYGNQVHVKNDNLIVLKISLNRCLFSVKVKTLTEESKGIKISCFKIRLLYVIRMEIHQRNISLYLNLILKS